MKEKIFVTGATGLVGYHVVKQLCAAGYEVVAAVRASSNTQALQAIANGSGGKEPASAGSLTIAQIDLCEEQSLTQAMKGCAAVVHCLGSVEMQASRQSIMDTNVGGTMTALKAAISAGARQFIHTSSLSVITGREDQFNVDESAPLRMSGENYPDSKVEAEQAVLAEAKGIAYTILRPGFIYGPGERAWMPRLIANIKAGKAMLIDGGFRATNVIYVENLARAVELALFNEKAYGQAFNLTDNGTPTKKELFDAIADGLDLPRVTKSIPRSLARVVFTAVSLVSPVMSEESRKSLSRFSPGAFRLAAINQGFSTAKAQKDLGYVNMIPFAQGMAQTLKTMKETGTMPPKQPNTTAAVV